MTRAAIPNAFVQSLWPATIARHYLPLRVGPGSSATTVRPVLYTSSSLPVPHDVSGLLILLWARLYRRSIVPPHRLPYTFVHPVSLSSLVLINLVVPVDCACTAHSCPSVLSYPCCTNREYLFRFLILPLSRPPSLRPSRQQWHSIQRSLKRRALFLPVNRRDAWRSPVIEFKHVSND